MLVQQVSTLCARVLCQNKKLTTSTGRSRPSGPAPINAMSPLHYSFYPSVGCAVQRHAAAPWRAWQSVIPTLMATTQPPDTDTLFSAAPRLGAQLAQPQATLSLHMNKPAFLLKPLGAARRLKTAQKKQVSTIQRNIHKQLYDSLADIPFERAILLSQSTSHTGAHLMQPSSEAYEAEDRCFRVSVARRLMVPHPAAPNATDFVQSCPDTSAAGLICTTVSVSTRAWILSSTSTAQSHTWMSPFLLQRAEKGKFDRYPHINFVPFILETTQAGLGHTPENSSATSCETLTTTRWPAGTHGQLSKVCSTVPSRNNNSQPPLRDLRRPLPFPVSLVLTSC